MNSYGCDLDPYRKAKEPLGIKGIRQTMLVINSQSRVEPGQVLTVRFPDLGDNDVIMPGTTKLSFKIDIDSTDPNSTVVANLGRSIVKHVVIKLEGREVLTLNNADIFTLYSDLWLPTGERHDKIYQGIQGSNGLKHRVGAGDAAENTKDEAVALAFGNRFCIPLDFELLKAHQPYYQGALRDKLTYELTFNTSDSVILSADPQAKYTASDISLEFDVVTNSELARLVSNMYKTKTVIYFERVVHHITENKNRQDTVWNISLSYSLKSLKGILLLFTKVPSPFQRKTEVFYNPKIEQLSCTVDGKPVQLYSAGLLPHQHFDEIRKLFAGGRQTNPKADLVCKKLHLHNMRLEDYLTRKYGLWLDFRSTYDNTLHGSGRRVGADGITIQINKKSEDSGKLQMHVFVVCDAQLNIEENRLKGITY